MNRWNIPIQLEQEIRLRDLSCIYCGVNFKDAPSERRNRPSWEHIINDAKIITRENIALCCLGCNASKGARTIDAWLDSKYCKDRNINSETIAPVALAVLKSVVKK